MLGLSLRRRTASLVAAIAMLAGCGGSQPPIGGPGMSQQSAKERPDRDVPRNSLLYVSDPGAHKVFLYSYPQLQLKGTITGISTPRGLCVNPATQNVWVVASYPQGEIIEFQHGATQPLRSLKLGDGANIYSCALNPRTGDLAVGSHNQGSDPGALYVFKNTRGKPKYYRAPGPTMYWPDFVAYDSSGNAFVDGSGSRYTTQVAELASGATKLHIVTPKGLSGDSPGGVRFDDTNLEIGNEKRGFIYQIADGEVTGKITLEDACSVWQFVIAGDRVIAPNACKRRGRVSIYDYPAGGAPRKVLTGLKSPFAAVISR